MESAKTLTLIGNILQTIWLVLYFIVGLSTSILKGIGALPRTGVWAPSITHALIFLVLVILCWIAMARLKDSTWRLILLVCGVVSLIWFGNLIAGILFIVAFFKASKAAN